MQRAVFQQAIQAAADSVEGLSTGERERLAEVGRTATVVGTNFNTKPGCPAVMAKLAERTTMYNLQWRFGIAFDRALLEVGINPDFNGAESYRVES